MILIFEKWDLPRLLQFLQNPKCNQSNDTLAIRRVFPNFYSTILSTGFQRTIHELTLSLPNTLSLEFKRYGINLREIASVSVCLTSHFKLKKMRGEDEERGAFTSSVPSSI